MSFNCFLLIAASVLLGACDAAMSVLPEKKFIHTGWEFKEADGAGWQPATVPGCVHTDLHYNGLIPDPFLNENELQWIAEATWEYRTEFTVDRHTINHLYHELCFDGLDTYAGVYLNGQLILNAENAFRTWKVDVRELLKGSNELRIVFHPTSVRESEARSQLTYSLPDDDRIFTRKAQFQYGWDWAPRLNTCGIWKDVYLESWSHAKLDDVYIHIDSLSDSMALLTATLDIKCASAVIPEIQIWVNGKNTLSEIQTGKPSDHLTKVQFTIENPVKWWPHNIGSPYLYNISVLLKDREKIIDSLSIRKGLRTVELIAEKDSIGESFYFKINGEPVYMKGANYIPQHSFQSQVTLAHYDHLLEQAVHANMNMLRVWGGGIYEDAYFYKKCDEKGIMVWQDFMFACAMYPGDATFLENVREEAIDNVKRLRNHACIALWCGNNEVSEGWHRWGWQDGRSLAEKEEIWQNYVQLFQEMLPEVVASLTDISYWETSPMFGRGDSRYFAYGDAHDWWVWHDGEPFELWERRIPRFMSEFGFQSFPSYETIRYMNGDAGISLATKAVAAHQKHARGFEIIGEYMERYFPVPENDDDYMYISQLLQAYGIQKGIEAHRRARPYNMGSLYWQLNDCWPAISWSGIDFFGKPKALHYAARHSFENVLLSFERASESLDVFVVNDLLDEVSGTLEVRLFNFVGDTLWYAQRSIQAPRGSSKSYMSVPEKVLKKMENQVFIEARFDESVSRYFMRYPKELALVNSEIKQVVTKEPNGFRIELSSETLHKNVFIHSDIKARLSDNYFDLLPGTVTTVYLITESVTLPEFSLKSINGMSALIKKR